MTSGSSIVAQTPPPANAKSAGSPALPSTTSTPGNFVDITTKSRVAFTGAPLTDPMAKGAIPQKTDPKFWNRLFHQKKDGTFEDVTEKAGLQGIGYGMGVAVAGYDNDGYEDLYVTAYGGNRLYHNNGDGTFTDVTEKSGTPCPSSRRQTKAVPCADADGASCYGKQCPEERERIDWKLVTDLPVRSCKEALEKLNWYKIGRALQLDRTSISEPRLFLRWKM